MKLEVVKLLPNLIKRLEKLKKPHVHIRRFKRRFRVLHQRNRRNAFHLTKSVKERERDIKKLKISQSIYLFLQSC